MIYLVFHNEQLLKKTFWSKIFDELHDLLQLYVNLKNISKAVALKFKSFPHLIHESICIGLLVSLCKYEMWNKFIIIYSVSVHVHWQNWVNFLLLTIPKNQIASKFRDVLLNNKTQWSRDAKKSSMSFKEFLCLKSFSMGCNQGSSPKDLH